jgi:NAD(P)-dependent dehydrogenase (short-subunit alcohol dehydrogenase family)
MTLRGRSPVTGGNGGLGQRICHALARERALRGLGHVENDSDAFGISNIELGSRIGIQLEPLWRCNRLAQVANGRAPRGAERPPRVWRSAARRDLLSTGASRGGTLARCLNRQLSFPACRRA